MSAEIRVPRLAESISEAVLVQWLKQDGDTVRADEPIATLETDKAAVEIPADRAGVLRHARQVGETVTVGDVIARVEEGNGEPAAGSRTAAAPAVSSPSKPAPAPKATPPAPAAPAPSAKASAASTGGAPAAPSRSAPSPATPPTPAGRPSPAQAPSVRPASPPSQGSAPSPNEGLSPAVRRMVEEFGLDPAEIQATGKGGRLLKEDVQRHLEGAVAQPVAPRTSSGASARAPEPAAAPAAAPAVAPKDAPWTQSETERSVPMSRIRQRIAERLVQAQHTAAILTTFNEVDMSAVMEMRARFKDGFEKRHGVRLSFMSFFTRACVLALQQVPEINAQVRGTDIVYQRHVHMGIAVQTERGLVVPVVRDADQRTFADLEKEIARLALAARENRVTLDELSGGTFTISNGGVFGSLLSTPILNPPQSGILGMHKIEKRPVVLDDQIVIRSMMYLALSYDHRIVDGEQAVTFLASVKQRLEDPERMLLDL